VPSVIDVPNAQAGSVSFGIIDERRALAREIVVDLAQRVPRPAGRRYSQRAVTALAPEDMQTLRARSSVRRASLALPFG
jgi:hypothetical protein